MYNIREINYGTNEWKRKGRERKKENKWRERESEKKDVIQRLSMKETTRKARRERENGKRLQQVTVLLLEATVGHLAANHVASFG